MEAISLRKKGSYSKLIKVVGKGKYLPWPQKMTFPCIWYHYNKGIIIRINKVKYEIITDLRRH